MFMMVLLAYLGIGLIIGLGSCLSLWSQWSTLSNDKKAIIKNTSGLDGERWLLYLVILVSRLIGWPIYLAAKLT